MISVLEQLGKEYRKRFAFPDEKSIVKGIIQDIILCGLSRGGFFKKATLCGGAALRVHCWHTRFNDDLEFALTHSNSGFDWGEYFPFLKRELVFYGLNASFEKENKKDLVAAVQCNELIRIRLKIDTEQDAFATFEYRYRFLPSPFDLRLYDMPSLFTLHLRALLGKASEEGIGGAQLQDYVCFVTNETPVDLKNLKKLLVTDGVKGLSASFTIEAMKNMLKERFEAIDYESAKQDILPFVSRPSSLDVWSAEFFCSITDGFLKARED